MYYDDLRVVPPKAVAVETVPAAQLIHQGVALSDVKAEKDGDTIRISRTFMLGGNFFPVDQFPALKHFYRQAATAEDAQIFAQACEAGPRPRNNSCQSGATCVIS